MLIQTDTLSRLWHTRLQQMVLPLLLVTMIGCDDNCQGVRVNYSTVFLQTQAEVDCNVIGEVFVMRCPNCFILPLNNGSFGWGEGSDRHPWEGDRATVVEGQTESVTPCHANRMLRFEASYPTDPGTSDNASTTYQVIDLRQTPLAEDVTFLARALVNRRPVDAETDRTFRLSLIAYAGDPTTFDPASTDHQQLGGNTTLLVADDQTVTWEALFTELRLRSTDIDFLLVTIAAVEDVVDDPGTTTEFDAHFVDYVQVGYTGVPYDLEVGFRVLPNTVTVGGQEVFELTLTNHTSNVIVTGAGVATEFLNGTYVGSENASTFTPSSRVVLRYMDHTGEGRYDSEAGTWHIDQLDGGATAKLYIAMRASEVDLSTIMGTTATIIENPNDQTTDNNQANAYLYSPASTQTSPPALALSDTTGAVGDTLFIPVYEGQIPISPSSGTLLSHPDVATTDIIQVEGLPATPNRYLLQVVGEAPGEITVVVILNTIDGNTADFFNLTVVTPGNRPPQATRDLYDLPPTNTVMIPAASGVLANDTDPDGDALTALLDSDPQFGTLTLETDGSFTYTANVGFPGFDGFAYRASDGEDVSEITQVYLQGNSPPTAFKDVFHAAPGTSTTLDVLFNDIDPNGDALSVALVGSPPNGTTEIINDGALIRFTPDPGFTDTLYVFGYVAADEHGASSGEAEIRVLVNDGPAYDLAVTAGGSMDEIFFGQPVTFTLVVSNNGPSDATGVTVAFPLAPALFTITETQVTQGTYDVGTWEVGALDAGDSATLTITGVPQRGGRLIFQALLTGGLSTGDDATNNTSPVILEVRTD